MIKINKTNDFNDWFKKLNKKEQAQVMARLERITNFEHFGDAKSLREGLCELRWKNGWRVYFVVESNSVVILILGGHKNEQEKNIRTARLFINKYRTN